MKRCAIFEQQDDHALLVMQVQGGGHHEHGTHDETAMYTNAATGTSPQ